jgi:hypothetical protein
MPIFSVEKNCLAGCTGHADIQEPRMYNEEEKEMIDNSLICKESSLDRQMRLMDFIKNLGGRNTEFGYMTADADFSRIMI